MRFGIFQVAAGMGGVGGAALASVLVHAVSAAFARRAAAHSRGVQGVPSHGKRKDPAKVGGLAGLAWLPRHDGADHSNPGGLRPI